MVLVAVGSVLALFIYDLFLAWHAHACSDRLDDIAGCYPWGGEGPLTDYPYYRTKQAYLSYGLVSCLNLAMVLPVPFLVDRARTGLLAMILVLVVGRMLHHWIVGVW